MKNIFDRKKKSEATIEKYVRDVKAFYRYAGHAEITKQLTVAYKEKIKEDGYAVRSINSMIAGINGLFSYLGWNDVKINPLKIQRRIFRPEEKELSKTEYVRLVCAARKRSDERLGMILQTLCGTGIRVSELQAVTVEAVKRGEAVITCKGKTRVVFIIRELQRKLLSFSKKRGIVSGCIFITRSGKPVSRISVWKEMKSLCADADIDPRKVFPHNLRHLFARIFYGIDKDIAKLADVLGHSSIDTTRIYIVSTGAEHRRHMELMHLII